MIRPLMSRLLAALTAWLVLTPPAAYSQSAAQQAIVEVRTVLRQLLADEDTDGDLKITVDDPRIAGTDRGDKRFWFHAIGGARYEVAGTYELSNLLQELTLLKQRGADTATLRTDRIFEPPVDRISRTIRDLHSDDLTRRTDEEGILRIVRDTKVATADSSRYIYVPSSDRIAFEYFCNVSKRHADWKLRVVQLPRTLTPDYVRHLDGHHGILSLALRQTRDGTLQGVPFVVPGGRFNEMYGWDSYFIVLGLLQDGRTDLAKSMIDNLVYEIRHYGAILNANRTYYLTRSQPPFLSSMALECYKQVPKDALSHRWLRTVLEAAIDEYRNVWMNRYHLTSTGLSRYFDWGYGPPPEVEPGHFDAVFARFAARHGMDVQAFEKGYRAGTIKDPELDRFFENDRAMRESGHDTSYRLYGRCAELVTVDLNSLLYKIERDIAQTIEREFGGSLSREDGSIEKSSAWYARAAKRKVLVNRYLWDADRGMFFDYDFVKKERITYVSATTFFPLWASLATHDQAARLVRRALPMLEMPGGIVGSSEESRGPITPDHPLRQWDYPYGWAPHQMLIWQGFRNYGMDTIATRLCYRWLFTITLNATQYNGTIPEKFDVVNRTHEVFAEYGNVGTKFSYITREGFGWTNASYQVGLTMLTPDLLEKLNRLIPPEWIFTR
jgi:alpha,alpha-trehalase